MPGKIKNPNQRLRQERERRFWTIEDVATRISNLPEFTPGEPDPRTVRRWEQGISFPSPRYCRALCLIFDLDAQALGLVPSPTKQENEQSLPLESLQAPAEQPPLVLHNSTQDAMNGQALVSLNSSATLVPPSLADLPAPAVELTPSSLVNTEQERAQPRLSAMTQQNRRRMLRKVRDFWISGVLEQSLHGASLLALGLHERRDAVANPWHLVLHQPEQAAAPLPPGTSISQIYDAVDGELLILGEPGSGKTTLLLELARTLLQRANEDEMYPIPVVFNLSSWGQKQRSLNDWLVEELYSKYQVPRKLAQSWVQNEQILPLLDGLDEVTASAHSACIETINAYRQQHGLLSLVVCCRQTEYLAQSTRLLLRRAVVVQPLSIEQIETYLTYGGEQFASVLAALRADTGLRELVTTPLWLNVLVLASQGQPFDHLLVGDSVQARQQQVFATYVQRMLERRGYAQQSTLKQMQGWLTWLARQMRRQDQTIFYLEHMQPTVLETEREQHIYKRCAVALPAILIGVLVSLLVNAFLLSYNDIVDFILFAVFGAVIAGLLIPWNSARQGLLHRERAGPHFWLRFSGTSTLALLLGLSYGLRVGPAYGPENWLHDGLWSGGSLAVASLLLLLLLSAGRLWHRPTRTSTTSKLGFWHNLFNRGSIGKSLLIGCMLGVSIALPWDLSQSIAYNLMVTWYNMMCLSVVSIVVTIILRAQGNTITPAEIITWSWRRFRASLTNSKHLQQALMIGVLSGLGTGISDVLLSGNFSTLRLGVSVGLGLGLSYWLLVALFQAIKNENLEDYHRVVPNQGIRQSVRNALFVALISSTIGFIMSLLEDTQTYALAGILNRLGPAGLDHMLGRALVIGLGGGLLAGLLNGGLACWRHGVLRFLLWQTRAFPRKATVFLNSATERLLLHKVGGGFIFIHRLLLEYLASLPTASKNP